MPFYICASLIAFSDSAVLEYPHAKHSIITDILGFANNHPSAQDVNNIRRFNQTNRTPLFISTFNIILFISSRHILQGGPGTNRYKWTYKKPLYMAEKKRKRFHWGEISPEIKWRYFTLSYITADVKGRPHQKHLSACCKSSHFEDPPKMSSLTDVLFSLGWASVLS